MSVPLRLLTKAAALFLAWITASFGAHLVAAHSDCVLAYRMICGWWAVLYACSKLEPTCREMWVAVALWIVGSVCDLLTHSGWIYPKSVDLVSTEAARLVALNAVFFVVVPFYVNRTVNLVLTSLRKLRA